MNWGYKLLATFIVFGTGMSFLVYRSMKTNYELVDKDYYNRELAYQQVIDNSNRAKQLKEDVVVTLNGDAVELKFPATFAGKQVKGNIHFYCAFDESNDRRFTINPDTSGIQVIRRDGLKPVTYTIKISWTVDGEGYYTEKYITLN